MECGDKSPLAKAVPRHRTPKDGVFRGRCPPLKSVEQGLCQAKRAGFASRPFLLKFTFGEITFWVAVAAAVAVAGALRQ